jgi:hypothetical protein
VTLTSPNAIPLSHTFTAFLIGVLCGVRRFAHTEMARADRSLHALLGLPRGPGADTVRALFHRFTPGTIQSFWRPLWGWLLAMVSTPPAGFSLDLDSTVFQRAAHQQGAAKGYNPRRPGRKSHHPLLAVLFAFNLLSLYQRGHSGGGLSPTRDPAGSGVCVRRDLGPQRSHACAASVGNMGWIRQTQTAGGGRALRCPDPTSPKLNAKTHFTTKPT